MGFTAEAVELFKDDTEKMKSLINKRCIDDSLKSLRTRARSTPSIIMTNGLPQTLAFVISKSNNELYSNLSEQREFKKEIEINSDEAGYTAYLYVVINFLYNNKLIKCKPKNLKEAVEVVKELDDDPRQASVVQNVLIDFLLEFKKISEALIR